jgi:CDGSH-type Zn-finger protein
MFVAAAKNEQTRFDRVAKFRQRILDGYGMNDCTCGLSRRMPGCDGSHKQLNKLKTE